MADPKNGSRSEPGEEVIKSTGRMCRKMLVKPWNVNNGMPPRKEDKKAKTKGKGQDSELTKFTFSLFKTDVSSGRFTEAHDNFSCMASRALIA